MADVMFDNPPALAGSEETQLRQLYNHLFTLSNRLNEAFMTLSVQESGETQVMAAGAAIAAVEKPQDSSEVQALKSMIIKTARIIRSEMDEISTELTAKYQAVSDEFGELNQNLTANIRATAEGVLQEYSYDQRIDTLEDAAGNTQTFITRTDQYIFSGLIDDTGTTPLYGIAIGEGVTAYDANGNPYLNTERRMATFTMEELAFWRGETKMAYFSSGKFYIGQGVIENSLQMGNFTWKILSNGAIALIAG